MLKTLFTEMQPIGPTLAKWGMWGVDKFLALVSLILAATGAVFVWLSEQNQKLRVWLKKL